MDETQNQAAWDERRAYLFLRDQASALLELAVQIMESAAGASASPEAMAELFERHDVLEPDDPSEIQSQRCRSCGRTNPEARNPPTEWVDESMCSACAPLGEGMPLMSAMAQLTAFLGQLVDDDPLLSRHAASATKDTPPVRAFRAVMECWERAKAASSAAVKGGDDATVPS